VIETRPLLRVLALLVLVVATVGAAVVGPDRVDPAADALPPSTAQPVTPTTVPPTTGPPDPAVAVPTTADPSAGTGPAASARAALLERLRSPSTDPVGVMTEHGTEAEIDAFAAAIGRQPDIVSVAVGWAADRFDPGLVDRIVARGAVPMIAWEPYDATRPQDPAAQAGWTLDRILDGTHDAYIDEWAAGLAAEATPVIVRFAHEMNGDWYPWAEQGYPNPPGSYVAAWRYVHDRFRAAGATEVLWLWSPNIVYDGSTPLAQVWPGAEYVDLAGVVGYFGHGRTDPTRSRTFGEVFDGTIAEIVALTGLPVMITETAGTERGGFKDDWVTDLLSTVAARPDVTGFVWFDVVKEADWRVDSSPEALAAFRAALELPAYSW
jgi:hypothetical protein